VAPTKSGSAVSPVFAFAHKVSEVVLKRQNMPRIQVTICGAPKAMAIPITAPIHQPHDMRFGHRHSSQKPWTKMMAIGVNHVRILVWIAVAPGQERLSFCAKAGIGARLSARATNKRTQQLCVPNVFRSSWLELSMAADCGSGS